MSTYIIGSLLVTTEIDILILLLFACLTAIAFKRIKFPYTIALVVVGLVLSFLGRNVAALDAVNSLKLSEDLILFIFVPPLIFESALNMDIRLLMRNLLPVLILAAPGLLLSTAIIGVILSWLTPLSLGQALLFGGLISATDPVAVIALFKELGAPNQLKILVEGESLFNDATAIVTFNIIYGAVASGTVGISAVGQGTVSFLTSFFGGILAGVIIGYGMRYLMSFAKENFLVLATITTITAYGTFLLAEKVLVVSPVMAVVSAGLVIGWYKSNRFAPLVRESMGEFWEYAAFLANSLIFLLVGITTFNLGFFDRLDQTHSLLSVLGIAIVTVLISRAVVVFGLIFLVNCFRESKISIPYQLVMYWGGLRGAVCLALALSIDSQLPNRDLIITLTLGIVLFTMLVPGTTIGRLMEYLQLNRSSISDRLGQALALLIAKQDTLDRFQQLKTEDYFSHDIIEQFIAKYQQEIIQAQQYSLDLQVELDPSHEEALQTIWLKALEIEHHVYNKLNDKGFVSQPVSDRLRLMTNLKLDAVRAGQVPPKLPPVESWDIRLYRLSIELLGSNSWKKKIQANLTAAQYEYLTFIAYAHRQVSTKLRNSVAERSILRTQVEDCAEYYERIGRQLLTQAQTMVKESGYPAIALQTKILNRISRLVRQETVTGLAEAGIITQAVAVDIEQADPLTD